MNIYEAGDYFLRVVQELPQDFSVSRESGRDHNCVVITHTPTDVSVVLDVVEGDVTASSTRGFGKTIRCIRPGTIEKLHDFATKRLAVMALQAKVDEDNKHIGELIQYYKDNPEQNKS